MSAELVVQESEPTPAELREEARRSLVDAIQTQIGVGHYEPETIATRLLAHQGERWVWGRVRILRDDHAELLELIVDQLRGVRVKTDVELVRKPRKPRKSKAEREREKAVRRIQYEELGLDLDNCSAFEYLTAATSKILNDHKAVVLSEFLSDLLVPQSVPGVGFKRRADLTPSDCSAIAESYGRSGATEIGRGIVFARLADAMTEQKVATLADLDPSRLEHA